MIIASLANVYAGITKRNMVSKPVMTQNSLNIDGNLRRMCLPVGYISIQNIATGLLNIYISIKWGKKLVQEN